MLFDSITIVGVGRLGGPIGLAAKAHSITSRVVVTGRDAINLSWACECGAVNEGTPDHDRALASTSHMPHAVAAGVAAVTPVDWLTLSAGGFRDTTRIAGGGPALWAAIFQANRAAVLAALGEFTNRIDEFRQLLEAGDGAGLVRWLAEAKQVRDALGS